MKLVHRHTNGRLPTSTFDLVQDGEVIGFTQIRHRPSHSADLPPEAANHIYYQIARPYRRRGYGKALLALALIEAKRIGLKKVRLTCDAENPVSGHIIEANGGSRIADFISRTGRRYDLFEITLRASPEPDCGAARGS